MAYFGTSRALFESILDRPKDDLDPAMWTKNADGEYVPTIQASQKIDSVISWAVGKYGFPDPVVHVTGSIASNSYGDKSDVDLHFCSDGFKPGDVEEFNREFRSAFAAEFGPETGNENGVIGVHPVEVYFQENPFQDMMSVGCYDYTARKWECGPEIKDTAFDPYSEYYEKDMKYVDSLVSDVRDRILGLYEQALVLGKAEDPEFKSKLFAKMTASMKKAKKLFDDIREKRRVMSAPKSKEAALKKRKDRKWHVADSAFKLLDRFGYMQALRSFAKILERDDEPGVEECVAEVVRAVQECVLDNKMLTDSDCTLTETALVGLPDIDELELKDEITAWLNERIREYGLGIRLLDIAFHGSRAKGGFRHDSDLDVLVYYKGGQREYHMFNMLNDDPKCEIEGVTVDFWPVRDEESGSIDDVLARNARFDAGLDEGLGSALRSTALAGMMLAPGIADAAPRRAALPKKPAVVQTAKAASSTTLSDKNLQNLLATVAYNEVMLNWMKYHEDDEIVAVLRTVENRGGKNKVRYAGVVSRAGQYFSRKHVKGGYVDSTYVTYDPNDEAKAAGGQLSPQQKKCWRLCQDYAADSVAGKLKFNNPKNDIGNRNMIGNPKRDTDKDAVKKGGWLEDCDMRVGGHVFGYQAMFDGQAKADQVQPVDRRYVVKPGDTLWKIAKDNGTTVQRLKADNRLKSDNLKPGQKLIV